MGTTSPVIAKLAHFGKASPDEVGLRTQERMIAMLQDGANWIGQARPDAGYFSIGQLGDRTTQHSMEFEGE